MKTKSQGGFAGQAVMLRAAALAVLTTLPLAATSAFAQELPGAPVRLTLMEVVDVIKSALANDPEAFAKREDLKSFIENNGFSTELKAIEDKLSPEETKNIREILKEGPGEGTAKPEAEKDVPPVP